jgi:hypothetical protein
LRCSNAMLPNQLARMQIDRLDDAPEAHQYTI